MGVTRVTGFGGASVCLCVCVCVCVCEFVWVWMCGPSSAPLLLFAAELRAQQLGERSSLCNALPSMTEWRFWRSR
ncbi:hypothetical protein AMECASPLE_030712 [Ameca splendens]|uniref:Secreted protein n=1 Tax=Ameca splendens TaxID=208324 RepID=A0ABV0Z621_9TELE